MMENVETWFKLSPGGPGRDLDRAPGSIFEFGTETEEMITYLEF